MDAETLGPAVLAAWERQAKGWQFLGYNSLQAQAVLAEFMQLHPKDRNFKPLHVLEKVGRQRVKAIVDALRAQQQPPPDAPEASDTSDPSDEATPDSANG